MIFDNTTTSVGQGVHVFAQPDLPIPVDPLHDLNRFKRTSAEQIAPCFLNTANFSKETRKALDLLDCSSSITLAHDGSVTAHRRCKKRVCATCSHIEGKAWSKRLHDAVKLLPDVMLDEPQSVKDNLGDDRAVGIKLTLNAGQLCSLNELRDVTRMIHRLWPRLYSTSAIKPHFKGAFRASEITISHTLSSDDSRSNVILANPHIHGLIMLIPPSDIDVDEWIKLTTHKLTKHWVKMIKSNLLALNIRGRSVQSIAQLVEPLNAHTPHDVASWLSYASKGAAQGLANQLKRENLESTYDELVDVWTTVDSTLNSVHLISASGSIKEALKHQSEIDQITSTEGENSKRQGRPKPTHRWSTPQRRYIPVEEWTREIDRPIGWQLHALKLSHTIQPKQLFSAIQAGRDRDILTDRHRILHHAKFGELLPDLKNDF